MGCFCPRNISERTLCWGGWVLKAKHGSHSLFLLARWGHQRDKLPWVGLVGEFRCVELGKTWEAGTWPGPQMVVIAAALGGT